MVIPHQFSSSSASFSNAASLRRKPDGNATGYTAVCVSELLPTGMEESAEADLVRLLTELECAASAFSVADGRR